MLWLPVARQAVRSVHTRQVCKLVITPCIGVLGARCGCQRLPSRCLCCFPWAGEQRCDAAEREGDTLGAGVG